MSDLMQKLAISKKIMDAHRLDVMARHTANSLYFMIAPYSLGLMRSYSARFSPVSVVVAHWREML